MIPEMDSIKLQKAYKVHASKLLSEARLDFAKPWKVFFQFHIILTTLPAQLH
jgi:hypothetical protein